MLTSQVSTVPPQPISRSSLCSCVYIVKVSLPHAEDAAVEPVIRSTDRFDRSDHAAIVRVHGVEALRRPNRQETSNRIAFAEFRHMLVQWQIAQAIGVVGKEHLLFFKQMSHAQQPLPQVRV